MSLVLNGTTGMTAPEGAVYNGIQSATAVASTSGTSITFSSIPSWVKRITVMFQGVSTSGTSPMTIRIGNGSVVSTGYASGVWTANTYNTQATTGFQMQYGISASMLIHGNIQICNISGNSWVANGVTADSTSNTDTSIMGGSITLSGTLDRVVVTTVNGTDTFDAGSINILYE